MYSEYHFRVGFHGIQVLLLKVDTHTYGFEHTAVFQAINDVSCKPRDRLYKDQLYLAFLALTDKPLEILAVI